MLAAMALGSRSLPSEREPTCQGRSLHEWLDEYYADSRERMEDDTPQTEAYFAIRAIGTNALPTLLRWVEQKPSPWRERFSVCSSRSSRRRSLSSASSETCRCGLGAPTFGIRRFSFWVRMPIPLFPN